MTVKNKQKKTTAIVFLVWTAFRVWDTYLNTLAYGSKHIKSGIVSASDSSAILTETLMDHLLRELSLIGIIYVTDMAAN